MNFCLIVKIACSPSEDLRDAGCSIDNSTTSHGPHQVKGMPTSETPF